MRNYVEVCKGICGYNLVYNFYVYFMPLKSSLFVVYFSWFLWCTFQTHFSIGKRHFENMILRLK